MKKILILVILVLVEFAAKAAFLTGTEDIPLMDGVVLVPAEDFDFDSPAGQILILKAKTKLSREAVGSFYDKTLRAMGWKKVRVGIYTRGGDEFKLSFPAAERVQFDITLTGAE